MISFRYAMINKQGNSGENLADWDATENLERKLCDFGAFLWLLEHLVDEAIDVDACGIEEVNAVMFIRAQE